MIRIKYIFVILFAIVLLNLGIIVAWPTSAAFGSLGDGFGADAMDLTHSGYHV